MRALAAVVMLSSLSACVVAPAYHVPESPVTRPLAAAQSLAARQAPVSAPTLDAWWLGFEDEALFRIVQRALEQNLDLAAAMARVEQARASAQRAGAARLPQVELSAQSLLQHQSLSSPLGRVGSAFPSYDRTQTWDTLGVGASWELDMAGALKHGQQAVLAEWQAAVAGQTGVKISIAAEAADAYFRIRGAQRRLAVADEQINTEEHLVGLVQDRFDGGLASNRELAQAQALLLEARSSLPPLRIELVRQMNRLDVLLGAQPGTYAKALLGEVPEYHIPLISAALEPRELLRRRPDVIAAERRLAASNARIGVAMAGYYPSISIAGLLGFDSLNAALFTSAAFEPQALLGLHWRLLDFGRVDADVVLARGAYHEALADYRQAMLKATEDVENAVVALVELETQRGDLEAEIAAHRSARDAAQDAYEGGAVSLIEVLDEDRRLLHARDLLAQVNAGDARAAVATFRALGGGWQAPEDVTTQNRRVSSVRHRPPAALR